MNRKTAYLIPVFAAVFALMFTVATPLAMAEFGDGMHDKSMGQKHKKMHRVIQVEGFVGSIQITEDSDRQSIKDQVSVSLSEAARDLDVRGGHIGVVLNENGDKFLAWTLKSVERDSESETAVATIYVVDAGDASNTVTITKEIDQSKKRGSHNYDGERTHEDKRTSYKHDGDRNADKAKMLERLSQPTGDADIDAARAAFLEKVQELKAALESEDAEKASELREELKDLRSELGSIKSYRK